MAKNVRQEQSNRWLLEWWSKESLMGLEGAEWYRTKRTAEYAMDRYYARGGEWQDLEWQISGWSVMRHELGYFESRRIDMDDWDE